MEKLDGRILIENVNEPFRRRMFAYLRRLSPGRRWLLLPAEELARCFVVALDERT
jgi:hypothetical protein